MNWIYMRALRHNGVNYHLWSTEDESYYALTRTAVIEPQNSAHLYRSLPELASKTRIPVVPFELDPPGMQTAVSAVGLYRREDGWVQVHYGQKEAPVPRDLYDESGYEPAFANLLSERDYRAFAASQPPPLNRTADDDFKLPTLTSRLTGLNKART